jgi:hypothetical protein
VHDPKQRYPCYLHNNTRDVRILADELHEDNREDDQESEGPEKDEISVNLGQARGVLYQRTEVECRNAADDRVEGDKERKGYVTQ